MSGAIAPVTTSAEIEHVAMLARRIWTQHYVPIIGLAQVEYMLERFQSVAAIAQQIESGHQYFFIRPATTDIYAAGYMDVVAQPESNRLFLSKLYVIDELRCRGFGRQLFEHALTMTQRQNFSALWLTVNKLNPSLQIYLRWGMVNKGSVVKDIGNGFVMDDYQLEITV
jgi:ribosomal protein S18 acetylase RimI-like enzyme